MKILAIDIGAGTQDILLYDSAKKLENYIKLVLPSPSPLLAAQVKRLGEQSRDIFITGHTVGGGALSHMIKALARDHRIIMTPSAAYTIRNNLDDVIASGIEIRERMPPAEGTASFNLDELDLSPLQRLLDSIDEDLKDLDAAAVAMQDHGAYESGQSNRKTRLSYMKSRLEENPSPLALSYLYGEVPEVFPRMASAAERLHEQLPGQQTLAMDTAPAAIAGCLTDKRVMERASGKLLLINAGNGHTLACVLDGGSIIAILEHHTRELEAISFASYLEAFCCGQARDEDAFMASGHGLFYLEEPSGIENLDLIAVTGPNREILEGTGLDFYYPAPGGDMMMTGPMGLVEAVRYRTAAS
ncbi:MAG: hypothetical protein A2V52_08445 [Actinobacteria bacterium RBG_19FT_COMBO_54_7]|nr:MAG: hypothetical protein A2V52_08445 [Actinobacteria bacterium RBG_19FT_COMBO_54_7]